VSAAGITAIPAQLVFLPVGAHGLTLRSGPESSARDLLIGGGPLGERIVMWWNFIGRSHEEIVEFRERWQRERSGDRGVGGARSGTFPEQWEHTLPAPELPNIRLRSRGEPPNGIF
jgi:quercetin 2,3-dioxygenase